jgi:DNA-binding NarL/FixJ family response regulator
MEKEILLLILQQENFWLLVLYLISFLFSWLTIFRLELHILGSKISDYKKLIPAILIMTVYSFLGKWVIPLSLYSLLTVPLTGIFLVVMGNKGILKVSWTAMLVFFSNAIGDILIIGPACMVNPQIKKFFFETPYGSLAGCLIETIVPFVLLIILPKTKLSLIPFQKKRLTKFDISGFMANAFLFYIVYHAFADLYVALKSNSQNVLSNAILLWISSLGAVFCSITVSQNLKKRNIENVELSAENEKLKNESFDPQEVCDAMESVTTVLTKVSNMITSKIQPSQENPDKTLPIILSPRQRTVFELIAEGKSNKEIAVFMKLSIQTIKGTVTELLDITGARNRENLIVFAYKNNLVE